MLVTATPTNVHATDTSLLHMVHTSSTPGRGLCSKALVRGALVTSYSPGDQDVLHAQHIIHGAAQRGAGICTATRSSSSDSHTHRFSIMASISASG